MKPYFIINNNKATYYIIPKDKEGEQIKYLDKKSINNSNNYEYAKLKLSNIEKLQYTIQLFSNTNLDIVKNYMKNYINLKSELIQSDELFIFGIHAESGTDYFLTYKNFEIKNDAINFCSKLNIIDECLIINLQND